MKHVLMVTIEVDSEDELVEAIDALMETPGVSQWTADVLSPEVLRSLGDRGHVIDHHKRARSWTAVAKHGTSKRRRRPRPL
jgi:hypothetical protein